MADIFISYSSKDKEKADQLSQLLASAGLSVWIDRSGIDVATSWSGEIVQAIDACKAFVVLLSPFSVESKNVAREVALAFEKNKKILPLDLEPVALSNDLQYHLAGIQRAPMTNIDAIIRALGKLGLEATQAPTLTLVKESDSRKSLMILPFDDLSPTGDNGWFADGIANELISALSNIKSLRVADQQATKDYKRYRGTLPKYATEMSVRYFIQGDVRKFGDQIKISSSLLDIETGEHLWRDSMKGTMEDIFDIQESVAKKVVDGLQIILTQEEKKRLDQKLIENAEAYELFLRGKAYSERSTKADLERAIDLYEKSVEIEPSFIGYLFIANASLSYSRVYAREQKWFSKAEKNITLAEESFGKRFETQRLQVLLALQLGENEKAFVIAKELVALAPDNPNTYEALGYVYQALKRFPEAAEAWEQCASISENSWIAATNCVELYAMLGDTTNCSRASVRALPLLKQLILYNPDNDYAQAWYIVCRYYIGEIESAFIEAEKILERSEVDGGIVNRLANIYYDYGDFDRTVELLQRSNNAGHIVSPSHYPLLQGIPKFDALFAETKEKVNG